MVRAIEAERHQHEQPQRKASSRSEKGCATHMCQNRRDRGGNICTVLQHNPHHTNGCSRNGSVMSLPTGQRSRTVTIGAAVAGHGRSMLIPYFGIRFRGPRVRTRSWLDRDVATSLLVQQELARERYDRSKTLVIERRL